MWPVLPQYSQHISPTWSCYYFLQWVSRYVVQHGLTPSGSGTDGGFQHSNWFLIRVFWSRAIRKLPYWHSWSCSWSYDFFLKGVMLSLYQHLIWFLTTFLFLLTWKFQQTIVARYCKLWHTGCPRWLTLQPEPNWLKILKPMQLNCLNNMTVVSELSLTYISAGYIKNLS